MYVQLANVALPLHPMVQQMITLYVATTTPQQHNMRSANPQLDEQRIRDQFEKSTDKHLASQLVFLYYILSHQEAVYTEPGRDQMPYSHYFIKELRLKKKTWTCEVFEFALNSSLSFGCAVKINTCL